jgi:hypothetical protein
MSKSTIKVELAERAEQAEQAERAEQAEHRAKGLPVIWYASIDHYVVGEADEFLLWEGYYTTQAKAEAALAEAKSGINPEWTTGPFLVVGGSTSSYVAGVKHILVD